MSAAMAKPTTTASPSIILRDLPPPTEQPSYIEAWKSRQDPSPVIFGLDWHNNYLAGCTSSGHVIVWIFKDELERGDFTIDDDYANPSKRSRTEQRKPDLKIQVSKGKLFSIAFNKRQASVFLIVCGVDGIILFSWRDFTNCLEGDTSEITPLQVYKPHFSSHNIEINAFDMDRDLHIYGASGDGFCYKWDTETEGLLQTYPSSKRGYLHTVKILPNSSHLLMGGEDGTIGMWDTKQDKLIASLDVKEELKGKLESNQSLWISHIDAANTSKHWWSVCGGASPRVGNKGGFLATWHAPTRSMFSQCITREAPQQIKFYENHIVSVADEGVVSYWKSPSCNRQQRVWCSPLSSYAVSIRDDGLTAVVGVGGTGSLLLCSQASIVHLRKFTC